MLHVLIALGLALGLGTGLLAAATGSEVLAAIAAGSAPLGTAFMNAIRMVVIPLVMAVIFTGVAGLGDPRKLGKLGGFTLGFFWITVLPAIVIGMGTMWFALRFAPDMAAPAVEAVQPAELPSFVDFLVSLIPSNPFAAASNGQLLPLIVFTVLFAAATGALSEQHRTTLVTLADAVSEALIKLVWWILWLAPIGVFGLAAPVTAQLGWGLVQSLAIFVLSVIVALAIYITLVYLPLLGFVARVSPVKFVGHVRRGVARVLDHQHRRRAAGDARGDQGQPGCLGSGGRSRAAPGRFDVPSRQRALPGGRGRLPGPPLRGALSHDRCGGAILATFLVSLTVAPVPSSGVMTLAPALDVVGVPMSGLAILLGIDRIPDMFRSTTNLLGQITASVLVDRWVGQDGEASKPPT